MSSINVEALLDSTDATAKAPSSLNSPSSDTRRHDRTTNDRRDGDRSRAHDDDDRRGHGHFRDRRSADLSSRIDSRRHDRDNPRSSRHRSRDRSGERTRSRVSSFSPDTDDRYGAAGTHRSSARRSSGRSRSRSPRRDRQSRDDRRRPDQRRRSRSPRGPRSRSPKPTDDERDRRTIFVQQLANRLRTRDLAAFFEKAGPVLEAQIVKDRVSGRSKGVGYVEFKDEESVKSAIEMTGQKLLGIPIIAQHTEAEKNRLARNTEANGNTQNPTMYQRLYVGNVHFSITEHDLTSVFEPFGELEMVTLQRDDATGRSRGFGFVQFVDPLQAREALDKMNGFELAGRPIRVGLGNEKFTPESTANLLQRHPGNQNFTGSAFSGSGGRGGHRGGSAREEKATAGASALDDTDVAGVNFSNYSREALMRKLARTDEPDDKEKTNGNNARPSAAAAQVRAPAPSRPSKAVLVKNVFDAAEEESNSPGKWVKNIEEDMRDECERSYGPVAHIRVDPNSDGDVYVKFKSIDSATNTMKGLNGRFFAGRTLTAQYMVEAVYNSINSIS